MSASVSVVIPAYNEAGRLPAFLDDIRAHFDEAYGPGYEVIVVDDGSRDGTAAMVEGRAAGWPALRLLRQPVNRGKGAAVRRGVLASDAARILYADADGATPIAQEARLRAAIEAGADLAAGSRLVRGQGNVVERTPHRAVIGRAYAGVTRLAVAMDVGDPQCGFKMFRREAAHRLMGLAREDGYLLDTEILGLAARLGLRAAEVGVDWHEVAGSKVNLVHDVVRMGSGLLRVRRRVAACGRGGAAVAPGVAVGEGLGGSAWNP